MGSVRVTPGESSPSLGQAGELVAPSAIRGPSAAQIPLRIEADRGHPLHEQISEQIRLLITEGKLRPGSYVPSSRQLADQLGVSRNTVLLAFSRLASEGYPVRVYVPYGTEWYPYLTRRMAERPANVWFFVSNLVRTSG